MDEPMASAASRFCRICGPGPILLALQVVALLAVALAAGFFHYRVGCCWSRWMTPVVARILRAHAGGRTADGASGRLDDWQPLQLDSDGRRGAGAAGGDGDQRLPPGSLSRTAATANWG
jgi:hypothetical protein